MKIGIVGHEAKKFTPDTEAEARAVIRGILTPHLGSAGLAMVSGHCHLGGVDIWSEEEAKALGIQLDIKAPTRLSWSGKGGFEDRNRQIAAASDIVHVVVVKELPPGYDGMRFPLCYHCKTTDHVKSGACWTAKVAQGLGKTAFWHII